jgi:hypothetical protein
MNGKKTTGGNKSGKTGVAKITGCRLVCFILMAFLAILFTQAAGSANTLAPPERVLVRDDVEQGIVISETRNEFGEKTGYFLNGPAPRLRAHLAGVDPANRSGIFIDTNTAASGVQSIRIQKAVDMNLGHLPALSWWLYNDDVIKSGTLTIAFDVKIPAANGNELVISARRFEGPQAYHDTKKEYIDLRCRSSRVTFFGQPLERSLTNWTRLELTIPVGVSEGRAMLKVTNADAGEKVLEAAVTGMEPGIDWIGFLMPGSKDAEMFFDNMEIVVTDEIPLARTFDEEVAADPNYWAASPAAVLDVFPPSTVEVPGEKGKTVATTEYYPSGSTWQQDLNEQWVFHREIKHEQDANNSFALRVGKGGQIYSLRGPFGESVPPSWRPEGPSSPWNDEVWQFVGVCTKYNDTLLRRGTVSDEVKQRIEKTGFPRLHLFVHNSGGYMEGDLEGLENLYCPMLAATTPDDGRTYRTLNWGLIPWNTPHRSPLLYYVQTRDVGDGVIELTWVVHNFSVRDDMVFDHLNAPWGGTRVTSLPHHFVSTPEGRLMDRNEIHRIIDMWNKPVDVRATGGWNLSCANENPDSPSLALVFGKDRHLEAELEKMAKGQPHCQFAGSVYRDSSTLGKGDFRGQDWRDCPENAQRNYDVAVVIPKFRLAPGNTIWYRSFLVVNSKDRAIELAKSLADSVDYGLLTFDPATTPLVPVYIRDGRVTDGNASNTPAFELFSKPVPGTKPLFLVENIATGREVITTDMYIFFDKEKLDWNLPPEHPDADYYNNSYAYRLEKNNSTWKRLLGYGYVNQPDDPSFIQLSSILDATIFPSSDTYHLNLFAKAAGK